jgi:hypothetical protein
MRSKLLLALAGGVALAGIAASRVLAQDPAAPSQAPTELDEPSSNQSAPQFAPAQLDQLLAPIALYPDALLSQILMASSYPLEVVQANRWAQDPNNAALNGAQLTTALSQQTWDPSVKSLIPFPQILHMMDSNLDWTEGLGDAFLADQGGVMDSVQRLRQAARAAGNLQSTPQEIVTDDDQEIAIAPPGPDVVYVPVCNPSLVYGAWPYPDEPPYYFTGYYSDLTVGAFGCGWWGGPIIAPLWGWDRWDWRHHRIDIDRGRYTGLNGNRPPIGTGGSWEHDPSHRRGVPYTNPSLQARFGARFEAPGASRSLRGFAAPAMPAEIPHAPPSFESFDRGSAVRGEAERGQSSRMSMPAAGGRPSGGGRGRR